jgi:endonuclease/exonuclease/phosphatase family metal-dependent hydrolase
VYATIVVAVYVSVRVLTDRFWPVTLIAFGPRWVFAIPILPIVYLILTAIPARAATPPLLLLAAASTVLLFGLLDFHWGPSGHDVLRHVRVLTHNIGESRVDPAAFDHFMREHEVDVAALQECPFYNNEPASFGWKFFYGGDMCLASRFPFSPPALADPDNAEQRYSLEPLRFVIDAPAGRFQLLNVHLTTIRSGLQQFVRHPAGVLGALAINRQDADHESREARRLTGHPGDGPLLIAGDFNLPVESAIYREHWSDFRNAFSTCGSGFGYTKHERLFSIRIDHVLMSDAWSCVNAQVLGTPYGGDHDPLIVDLRFRTDR